MRVFRTLMFGLAVWFVGAGVGKAAPILHYQLDEGIGATTTDSGTGTSAPGTLVGATWTTNTPNNYSPAAGDSTGASGTFGGTLKYLDGGDVDKIDGLSQFTLTQWINFQALPAGNRRLMSKQEAGNFNGFSWNVSDPGDGSTRSASAFGMRMFIGGSTAFTFDGVPSDPDFVVDADNKWAFVAVSYDGTLTSDNTKYYAGSVDGSVSLLATTTVNAGTVNATTAPFHIGHTAAAPTSDTSIPGFFDDARVYGSVLELPDLEAVRLENVVPEPASMVLMIFGATASLVTLRRLR